MIDLEYLLRSAMRRQAEDAPSCGGLLAAVHRRSRRLARRRLTMASCVVILAAAAVPVSAVLSRQTIAPAAPSAPVSLAASWPTSAPPSPSTVDSSTPVHPPESSDRVELVAPAYPQPVLPLQPAVTPAGGLAPPVVTLVAGELVAYYAANDPVRGADVTIRVGPRPPAFDTPDHPVHQTPQRVRGHPATLRTVVVAPANQLSLYWLEQPGRWVRVDTDDTLTDAELVRLADALAPAAVPVVTPFRLDLVPAGMALDTSTSSAMGFRRPGAAAVVSCKLVDARPVTEPTVAVGRYRGVLRRTPDGATLTVALDDRKATLVVQVPAAYPIGDADLIRFAAGIHLTDRAEPGS